MDEMEEENLRSTPMVHSLIVGSVFSLISTLCCWMLFGELPFSQLQQIFISVTAAFSIYAYYLLLKDKADEKVEWINTRYKLSVIAMLVMIVLFVFNEPLLVLLYGMHFLFAKKNKKDEDDEETYYEGSEVITDKRPLSIRNYKFYADSRTFLQKWQAHYPMGEIFSFFVYHWFIGFFFAILVSMVVMLVISIDYDILWKWMVIPVSVGIAIQCSTFYLDQLKLLLQTPGEDDFKVFFAYYEKSIFHITAVKIALVGSIVIGFASGTTLKMLLSYEVLSIFILSFFVIYALYYIPYIKIENDMWDALEKHEEKKDDF